MRFILFALALLTPAFADAQSLNPPTYSVDDKWTMKTGEDTREIRVLKVGEGGNVEMLGFLAQCPTCIVQLDRTLNIVAVVDGSGKPADVTQLGFVPIGGQWEMYRFPLEDKKRWDFSATGYLLGRTRNYEVSNRVEGAEDVKTPAGTFKAYRIVRNFVLKPASPTFLDQRDRTWQTTTWFAPDVKFAVKFTSTNPVQRDTELLSYSVK